MFPYPIDHRIDGPIRFVLAQSGHVAGVINSPKKKKYGYWTNDKLPMRPSQWFDNTEFTQDSWWNDWHEWQKQYAGKKVAARKIGNRKYKPIEDAPGAYALIRV